MEILIYVLISIAAVILLFFFLFNNYKKKGKPRVWPIPESYKAILAKEVPFYTQLSAENKESFEHRMQVFLAQVRITGVNTEVEDLDRVLVAASAIIPIFGFPGWEYNNLHEVLLYPDSFGDEFEQEGDHRSTLGMVGSGAMNRVMILSQHELRQSFLNKTGKTNVGIHEFVHLVDKTDGSVDGVPNLFMAHQYVLPWVQLMHQNIKEIMSDKSDINPYGATNEAEFFAVVSEYFFERPDLLRSKHPELYELLVKIFHQRPSVRAK